MFCYFWIIYIYIYIYLLILYLPAFPVPEKKKPPGTGDKKYLESPPGGKRKNIIGEKEKKGQPHQTP